MASIHATELSQLGNAARCGPQMLFFRVVDAALRFLMAWKNRREVYRLGEFSDTQLADIGLTRSDLYVVIDLPLGRDPTVHLGAIAARHREAEAAARWDV